MAKTTVLQAPQKAIVATLLLLESMKQPASWAYLQKERILVWLEEDSMQIESLMHQKEKCSSTLVQQHFQTA